MLSTTWPVPSRSLKCLTVGPTKANTRTNRVFVQAKFPDPCRKSLRFSEILYQFSVAPIALLFTPRCPADIAGFVIAMLIWVSVKRMIRRWCRTHIVKKCGERSRPLFAYRNSFASVIRKLLGIFWIAPSLHCCPARILVRSLSVSGCVAMFRNAVDMQAATRLVSSASQVMHVGKRFSAAGACAMPRILFPHFWSRANNSQSAKYQVCQIKSFHAIIVGVADYLYKEQ